MSGIEIAGLVLGCLPLLIQGIESYNEGLDPIKSFFGWEKELPQFVRKLRNQHVHYSQTIRILLEPITADVELAEMMTDPGSSQLWKDKEMAVKLQNRLQESYQAYQSTIADIERITKRIASKLDLDRANELKRNDLEALLVANPKKANDKFEFTKRIRFGMSKKNIKALLEELNECNRELERFTEKSEKIETYRKTAKPSFATRLQRIQGYAKSVHASLCWSCSCKHAHRTSLRLEPRGHLYASGQKPFDANKIRFTVSFSSLSVDTTVPWTWQDATINIEEEERALTPMPSPKPQMTKSVSFGSLPPYSIADPAGQQLQEVEDLCASIQRLRGTTSYIGFSLDVDKKLRGGYVIDAAEKVAPPPAPVTLEDLLDRRPIVNGRPTKLSKKERYNLALTLASSVLYLNSTPWLKNEWATKDILFHQASTPSDSIDIEHPYVAPISTETVDQVSVKPKAFRPPNKNSALLALAIALLELYFGMTVEKYQQIEYGSCDPTIYQNPVLLFGMALQWAEEAQEDLSAAFLSAVRHCLHCFGEPVYTLKDTAFLHAAAEGIVLPLQEELYQFLGKTAV